jgi:hypothetical protein
MIKKPLDVGDLKRNKRITPSGGFSFAIPRDYYRAIY